MNYQEHAINRNWSAEGKIDLYRQMMRIRRLGQRALHWYGAAKMGGWLILSIGQESIAAGVRSVMGPDDHGISGPRGMGHAIAAGLASALKHRDIKGAVFCFLGDGSVNQGVYHESLNLAGLLGLPVIYVIENNGYAVGSPVARSSKFTECLARRAETYGIDWDCFDGEDPYEVRARVSVAVERARHEARPTVLEISTYRYYGFTFADANHKKYRTPEESEARRARDPLEMWGRHLVEQGISDDAKAEAKNADQFAESGSAPTVSGIGQDVYWESDHATEVSRIGRHFFDD